MTAAVNDVHLMSDDLPETPVPTAPAFVKAPIEVKPAPPAPTPALVPKAKTLSPIELAAERSRIQDLIDLSLDCRTPETDPGLQALRARIAKLPAEPAPIKTLDPGLEMREDEKPQFKDADIAAVAEYEHRHPDFFPIGTTLEKKIEHLKKIGKVQADEKMVKQASFAALDKATEKKALEIETAKNEIEIADAAREIYEGGEFIEYCKMCFEKIWLGDIHILEGVLFMYANMMVENAIDGFNIHLAGPTQSGKSDSGKASLRFIRPDNKLVKTFSTKYLYYAELHPCTIIFSDDTTFDPETAALYRGMLTSWHTGVIRGTVDKGTGKDLYIPPRVSLILTSVESVVTDSDDGQDESRFLTLEVRRTPERMREIRAFIQEDHPDIVQDLEVVHTVWTLITPQVITLHKTIERDIPIREFKRFLTLVQSHALLCNRTTTTDADFIAIDQFLTYSKPMIDSETPAFTRREAVVLQCLSSKYALTVSEIVDKTGMSILEVYRALRGNKGSFSNPSGGLMQKEPRLIHIEERSEFQNNIHSFKLKGV